MTSWEPKVEIWFYDENYLRFTTEDYDPTKLHDKFKHLCNNSIQTKSDNYENSQIKGSMWDTVDFRAYLTKEYTDIDPDVYTNII